MYNDMRVSRHVRDINVLGYEYLFQFKFYERLRRLKKKTEEIRDTFFFQKDNEEFVNFSRTDKIIFILTFI